MFFASEHIVLLDNEAKRMAMTGKGYKTDQVNRTTIDPISSYKSFKNAYFAENVLMVRLDRLCTAI